MDLDEVVIVHESQELVDGEQPQPGIEQYEEEDGGNHWESLPGHLRSQDSGGEVDNAFKEGFDDALEPARDKAPVTGSQDEKQDYDYAHHPGGKHGVGDGKIGNAQWGGMVLPLGLAMVSRTGVFLGLGLAVVRAFRPIPEVLVADGSGEDGLRGEVNFRLGDQGVRVQYRRAYGPLNQAHHQKRHQYHANCNAKALGGSTGHG